MASTTLITTFITTTISSIPLAATPTPTPPSTPTNTTAPNDPLTPKSCDEFTRANIVGVFITLVLCLLTQPSGSLYFRGHGGFLWRINPVASFVEACIIFRYLGGVVWEELWDLRARRRRGEPVPSGWWAVGAVVLERLQRMAGALLLLRGQVDVERGEGRGGRGEEGGVLLETLLRGTFLEGDGDRGGREGSVGGGEGGSGDAQAGGVVDGDNAENGDAQTAGDEDGENRNVPPGGVVDGGSVEMEVTTEASETSSPGTPPVPEISAPPPRYQQTPVEDDEFEPPQFRRRRLLREAFGSNALAHRESRIASVTFFSVFVILIKMFTVTGAAWFKAGVWFSLSGWLAVQTLLILLHYRSMTEQDMTAAIKLAGTLDRQVRDRVNNEGNEPVWLVLFAVMHAPLFGYLAYQFTFGWRLEGMLSQRNMQTDPRGYDGFFFMWTVIKGVTGLFLILMAGLGAGLCFISMVSGLVKKDLLSAGGYFLGVVGSLAALLLLALVWFFGAGQVTMDDILTGGGESVPLKVGYYTGYGIWNGLWLVVDTFMLTGFFYLVAGAVKLEYDDILELEVAVRKRIVDLNDRFRVAVWNLVFTLSVFLWYLLTYQSQGTRKWWVGEYLG